MKVETTENSIHAEMVVKAPQAAVWAALTDPEQFGQWFCQKATGTVAKGEFLTLMFQMPSGECFCTVKVEEFEPMSLYAWRWHPGGACDWGEAPDGEATLVTFRLEAVDGGTKVSLLESGFELVPDERRAQVFGMNCQGWDCQMDALAAFSQGV